MEDAAPPSPSVHVTIPAYGDGPLLREAVASVIAQDGASWRLTISDDGPAAPELEAWLASFDDERIAYRRNTTRLGLNRNFQRCLDLAESPYVVVMGADDRMLPNYVTVVLEGASRFPEAAWIQPRVRVIDGQGHGTRTLVDSVKARLGPSIPPEGLRLDGEPLATSLLRGVWMYFPAVAFRRDLVQAHGFRERYDVILDLDLYLRLILDGATAVYLDDVAFEYRRHEASLSSRELLTGARFEEDRAWFREAHEALLRRGWTRAARAAVIRATSRLHAVALLPRARSAADATMLLRHAVGA